MLPMAVLHRGLARLAMVGRGREAVLTGAAIYLVGAAVIVGAPRGSLRMKWPTNEKAPPAGAEEAFSGPVGLPPRGVVDRLAPGERVAGASDEGEVIVLLGAIGLAEEKPGCRR
jgi:hypothetical protein